MRLTALCMCGTLLAFLSLSRTTADEADLLGDRGFKLPCVATLRPEGPCRQGQDETCPYLFSLPPLTLYLPKQLRELEEIVKDLQKLKDNVDQLRKMCADCTVSQTERECARQRENEGTDERLNERRPKECGTDRVKDGDSEKRTNLEEKERNKWEGQRGNDKGVVKENEREETLKEVAEKDGKTKTEGAKGTGQAKVPMGNERIVVKKKVVEKNNRETDRDKDGKGDSKGDPEDKLENGKERTSNVKNTEESDHHVWRDERKETEKKTQTEEDRGSDGIKMSEDHDEHTNKETEKEMEKKGIKVERNNEKPKQTESIGHAEKEKTIKEGKEEEEEEEENGETGTEIKTGDGEKTVQSVQRDSDGELASSTATERTDFVSISPTIHSVISLAPRHDSTDSNEAITFTSSFPFPPLSSSTSHLITDGTNGLPTQSTDPDAEEGFRTISRPTAAATRNTLGGPGKQITGATSSSTSTTSKSPGAGFQGRLISTTTTATPRQKFYSTAFPGVAADRSRWTAKKNISSNTKTGVKPLPGLGPKPGEKHKPAMTPEAVDQKIKNPKIGRKPGDRAPMLDKKTKPDQKQKHQKPTTDQKSKPGKDPKRVQTPKPDQRPNLPTDQNLKNNKIPKHDHDHTTDQSQFPSQRPTSQTVNATGSDKDPRTDPESVQIITQNPKPEKKPVHPLEIGEPDQTQEPHKKPKSEEKRKQEQKQKPSHQKPTTVQKSKPGQDPKRPLTDPSPTDQILKNNKIPKQDQEHTTDQNQLLTQRPTSHKKSVLPVQRPQTVNTSGSDKDLRTDQESVVDIPIITQNSNTEKKPVRPLETDEPDETQEPHKTLKSEQKTKPDQKQKPSHQKPTTEQKSKPGQDPKRPLPDHLNNQIPKHDQEHTTAQNQLPTQTPKSHQKSALPVQIPTSHQRPQTVNATSSDKDLPIDREPESVVDIPIITQNSKPEKKPVRLLETNEQEPLKKPKSEEKTNQSSTINQHFTPVQEPEPGRSEKTGPTPKPNQRSLPDHLPTDQNLKNNQIPKQDQEHTTELPTQKPKSHQKSVLPVQRPQTVNATGSNKDLRTDREPELVVEIPIITQNSKPEKKPVHPLKTNKPDETQEPHRKPKSEEKTDQRSTINQYFTPVQEPGPETGPTPKPNQRPLPDHLPTQTDQDLKNNQIPKHDQERTTEQNQLPTQKPTGSDKDPRTDRDPESVQIITQDSKPDKKPVRPLETDEQEPPKKPKSEEKTDQRSTINQYFTPVQEPESERSETTGPTPKSNQKMDENPLPEPKDSTPKLTPDRAFIKPPDQKPKPIQKIPKINQKPKPNQKNPKLITGQKTKPIMKPKPDQTPQTNQGFRTPLPDQTPDFNLKSVPDESPGAESNKTSKPRPPPRRRPPTRPAGATPVQRPKPAKPSPKTKTDFDLIQISGTNPDNIQNSQTDMPGPVTQIAEEFILPPGHAEFSPSTMKTMTQGPKASDSLETGPFPRLHTPSNGVTTSPNSRITSDLTPQTAGRPPSIPMTTRPNIRGSVIPSAGPGSTKPKILHNVEETGKKLIPVPAPRAQTTSTLSPDLGLTTPATSGPEPPAAAEASTASARELRVKINQVDAFFNYSLSPNGRPPDRRPKEHAEDTWGGSRPESKTQKPSKVSVTRDCADHLLRGGTKSGVYLVTPDLRSRSFPVLCDMELDGGGWTILQRRHDGSVSFNRSWAEYRSGFGELRGGGEFWLGNTMIHLLTRDRDTALRVELQDFDGVTEYAEYAHFRVASERLRYRLTVGGYSGTAGDALRFSRSYDHNNRAFTTPDRDHDRYPSGNCGAYYSSGWWFDACMAANLNGRYYTGRYKGVRDGIFWGTWRNISAEYYPTNDRLSFKTVRMMIRPRGFTP